MPELTVNGPGARGQEQDAEAASNACFICCLKVYDLMQSLGHDLCGLSVCHFQIDHELIAPYPSNYVVLADRLPDTSNKVADRLITVLVAKPVIEGLQPVQISKYQNT